jgi:hypothetical protein
LKISKSSASEASIINDTTPALSAQTSMTPTGTRRSIEGRSPTSHRSLRIMASFYRSKLCVMRNPCGCAGLRARRDRASSTQLLTDAPAVSAASSMRLLSEGRHAQRDPGVEILVGSRLRGDRGVGDAQCGIAVGQDEIDGAVGKLGPHLARRLLGKLHGRLADGRCKRRREVVDRLLDGDVAAGQGSLRGERRLHGVDDRLDLHVGSATATETVEQAACAAGAGFLAETALPVDPE